MSSDSFRILFAGNPELSVATLEAIAEHHTVAGVLVHPDKRAKRGNRMVPVPVKEAAVRLQIPTVECDTITDEVIEEVKLLEPDLLISFATGHYFTQKFLSLFERGSVNVHPSLLPYLRGPSPIQYTILSKEPVGGITLQRIVKKIDSGEILNSLSFALDGNETSESLMNNISSLAANLTVQTLESYTYYSRNARTQEHDHATYTRKLTKEDGLIDFSGKASDIHAMVRAYYPWPKAYTFFRSEQLIIAGVSQLVDDVDDVTQHTEAPGTVLGFDRLRGFSIACGSGTLYVNSLQLSKKKEMDARSFLNGNPDIIGSRLKGE